MLTYLKRVSNVMLCTCRHTPLYLEFLHKKASELYFSPLQNIKERLCECCHPIAQSFFFFPSFQVPVVQNSAISFLWYSLAVKDVLLFDELNSANFNYLGFTRPEVCLFLITLCEHGAQALLCFLITQRSFPIQKGLCCRKCIIVIESIV